LCISFKLNVIFFARFEAFTAAIFEVEVFWAVTPCSVVVGFKRFRGPCCLRLHVGVKTRRHNLEDFLNGLLLQVSPLKLCMNFSVQGILISVQRNVFLEISLSLERTHVKFYMRSLCISDNLWSVIHGP